MGVGRTQRDKGCCFALAIGCGGKMSLLEEIGEANFFLEWVRSVRLFYKGKIYFRD